MYYFRTCTNPSERKVLTLKRFKTFFHALTLAGTILAAWPGPSSAQTCQHILILTGANAPNNALNVLENNANQNCSAVATSGTATIPGICTTFTTAASLPGSLA